VTKNDAVHLVAPGCEPDLLPTPDQRAAETYVDPVFLRSAWVAACADRQKPTWT